ncbi:MAG: bifunctional diaminohydroxyphosphoribosylaminopyrimidine deaminase/5-amino-6-(5-phosphoribosylamino)uracil reductase RibD [Deltaproteobacteria bacterium]|nr:bifunctional diaminohydroxyphosphoribosylaminopyrimidine deaminase/5-amino-6-(5-phosphoribosylamino)uracil reductase RibD [Deltaproteobacteria bacterium]
MTPLFDDEHFMRIAIDEANKSRPSPNPKVGAVIVKDGKIISKGFHTAAGNPHAEIEAIKNAEGNTRDTTIYVTLEPCCHYGKTPPCTDAIIAAGISRVVVGMLDPDEKVKGTGIKILSESCDITTGVLETDCKNMLEGYIHHRTCKLPFVHLKSAITLDGFTATKSGDSKWITDETSRTIAHNIRSESDAVLVGINTVLKDDPDLTVRLCKGINPVRIVLDTNLKIPMNSKLVNTAGTLSDVIIIHKNGADLKKIEALHNKNVKTIENPVDASGYLDLKNLISEFNNMGFLKIMVEGGATVTGSFIRQNLADKLSLFIAPKIIGEGISWSGFKGADSIKEGNNLKNLKVTTLANDILIEGYFK